MREPTDKDWAKVFGVEKKLEELTDSLHKKMKDAGIITQQDIIRAKNEKIKLSNDDN